MCVWYILNVFVYFKMKQFKGICLLHVVIARPAWWFIILKKILLIFLLHCNNCPLARDIQALPEFKNSFSSIRLQKYLLKYPVQQLFVGIHQKQYRGRTEVHFVSGGPLVTMSPVSRISFKYLTNIWKLTSIFCQRGQVSPSEF